MKIANFKYGYAQGFSIVELLVSLVIASVILGGVVQVALSGKRSAMDGQEVSFIQDNARYVIDQLKRDTMAAGFMGCAGAGNTNLVNAVVDDLDGFINLEYGIQGYEADAGATTFPDAYEADVASGTDSYIVRYADAGREYKVKTHSNAANTFFLWEAEEIPRGTTLMATDSNCRSTSLFQSVGSGSSSTEIDHTADASRNCTSVLKTGDATSQDCSTCTASSCGTLGFTGQDYFSGSVVMPYRAYAYYIGESTVVAGMPALKRRALSTESGNAVTILEEIAHGVEDMQVSYGVDINQDGSEIQFFDADAIPDNDSDSNPDWESVVTVRITLTFRSSVDVYSENQNVVVKIDGVDKTLSTDKILRQVVTTTIRLRNT